MRPGSQGGRQVDWARTLRELRTWLPRLGDSAQPAQAQLSALELVERGALALLFLARQARLQHGEGSAAEALRELRLLASLLQAQARKSAEFGSGADGSDQIDSESAECDWRWVVAATLRPWMCQEAWCSPRVEVVDYRPCCGTGGLLLASNCDHKDLRAVLDIIVSAPADSELELEPELGRQRLLHRGPWQGFRPTEGGWHASFGPAGSALHRWEEVTVPVILLEAPCGARQALCAAFAGFRVVELQDLESDESANLETETSIFLLTRDLQTCAEDSFLDVISPKRWFDLLLARGGVRGGAPDVLDAQRSQVVSAGFLSLATLGFLERLAAKAAEGCGRVVRSAPQSEAWQVSFLQTGGFFAREAPELLERLAEMARSVGLREHWLTPAQAERLQARVVEWHDQGAPGPGIPDPRHYDMDSLVTVDVLCAEPKEDFEGGELRTLESDGSLKEQSFGLLEVLVFQAHKYHMVAPVTRGRRRALVLEFWDGPARGCPHRCISFEERCPLEPGNGDEREEPRRKAFGRQLPFRLASAQGRGASVRLLWQCNEPTQLEMPLLSLANITLSSARHVSIAPHEPGGGANPVEGRRSWRFRNTGARIKGPIATFPEAVDVGVGDIGLFQELLSQPQETIGDFDGPVALLGQDLMTQMPLRYSAHEMPGLCKETGGGDVGTAGAMSLPGCLLYQVPLAGLPLQLSSRAMNRVGAQIGEDRRIELRSRPFMKRLPSLNDFFKFIGAYDEYRR
ncbi:hypothetical protein AK812_SmicGene38410, partial [Symbiodinium microadriaticum]